MSFYINAVSLRGHPAHKTGPGYLDFVKAFTDTEGHTYVAVNYWKNYGSNNVITSKLEKRHMQLRISPNEEF